MCQSDFRFVLLSLFQSFLCQCNLAATTFWDFEGWGGENGILWDESVLHICTMSWQAQHKHASIFVRSPCRLFCLRYFLCIVFCWQAYIVSCVNSRLNDLAEAAKIIKGNQVRLCIRVSFYQQHVSFENFPTCLKLESVATSHNWSKA